jgi:hypothetical protein
MCRINIGILLLLVVGLMVWLFGCGSAIKELGLVFDNPAAAGRPSPSFNTDILPILTERCAIAECHVVDGPHDIDLRTYDTLMKGGDEGAIVLADNARESEIVEEIAEGKMPPEGPPLDAAQIQLIIDWINEGAKNN